MRTEEVREALSLLGADGTPRWGEIRPIPGGPSYWSFAVEPDCTFRFPKDAATADCLRNEARLLLELGERVSFQIPRLHWMGRHSGLPFAGHRSVPGRPLEAADIAMHGSGPGQGRANARERISEILAEIHGFPKQRAARLLDVRNGVEAWTARYQALREQVEANALPLLAPSLRAGVERATRRFFEKGLPHFSHPVLVHGNLTSEHILVDDTTGLACAVIDFESAALGDPVIDFVGFWTVHGPEVSGDVLARYGGPADSGFGERLHFYQWMISIHAILHGLEARDEDRVAEGVATLEARLERPTPSERI
jgi:aminoglycoside 2''-phosphotransferase